MDVSETDCRKVSVIIPCHNEASVIERCLRALYEPGYQNHLDVIVVCNGCTDDTEGIVRRLQAVHGESLKLLSTSTASKTAALNIGDDNASYFPRFYVDADVQLSGEHIIGLASKLESSNGLAGAPRLKVELSGCTWVVRQFYRIWLGLPYVNNSLIGCGVYALTELGRARFQRFPELIADDCFVRMQFLPEERVVDECSHFTIFPPRNTVDLVKISVRRLAGHEQLRQMFPRMESERFNQRAALLKLFSNPYNWPALCVYILIKLLVLADYHFKKLFSSHLKWNRDLSSR